MAARILRSCVRSASALAASPAAVWQRGAGTSSPYALLAPLVSRLSPAAHGYASQTAPDLEAAAETKFRNFAVIAHVDHGKTTLMDKLLREAEGDAGGERAMDSLSLEKERGITIQAKYTSFRWRDFVLNAVDTPGHADFGGEVERVLGMVDGVVLVVDAGEGPLAQTKFVCQKALQSGLAPILVLNKVDRDAVTEQRCTEVMSQVFDLFASLGANDHQLDFPTIYASARMGWAAGTWEETRVLLRNGGAGGGMAPILDAVCERVPAPPASRDALFRMVVTMMEKDNYLGRLVTGRVASGSARVGDRLRALPHNRVAGVADATPLSEGRITKILKRRGGFGRDTLEEAVCGDIITVAGIGGASVTDTLASMDVQEPLPTEAIDPPTLTMMFRVNDSPLAGRDGSQLTGSKIGQRLLAEAETNVSIRVIQQGDGEAFEVQGRGELQLGVLIENMRREGFELSVSPPVVLLKQDERGATVEPVEEVVAEIEEAHVGQVIESLTMRGADLIEMLPGAGEANKTRILLHCPSRGLLGYRSLFNTITRGEGLLHRSFQGYSPLKTGLAETRRGVLISMTQGSATGYALMTLEERGSLFIKPGAEVYDGMIIGECSREGDMEVNPTKEKKLTNVRNTGSEEQVRLSPPRRITLEEAIGYVREGELLEITPAAIRLRKRLLDPSSRKAAKRTTK